MGPQFVLTVAFAFVSAGVFTGTTVGTLRKVERKNFAFLSTHATDKLSTSRSLRSFASGLLLRETKRQLRASSRVPPLPRSSRHQIFLKLFHRNPERKRRMKNIRFHKTIKSAVSRLRIAAAGVLLLGAAALAAVAVNPNPPKLPWSVPTVNVGINPVTKPHIPSMWRTSRRTLCR